MYVGRVCINNMPGCCNYSLQVIICCEQHKNEKFDCLRKKIEFILSCALQKSCATALAQQLKLDVTATTVGQLVGQLVWQLMGQLVGQLVWQLLGQLVAGAASGAASG